MDSRISGDRAANAILGTGGSGLDGDFGGAAGSLAKLTTSGGAPPPNPNGGWGVTVDNSTNFQGDVGAMSAAIAVHDRAAPASPERPASTFLGKSTASRERVRKTRNLRRYGGN